MAGITRFHSGAFVCWTTCLFPHGILRVNIDTLSGRTRRALSSCCARPLGQWWQVAAAGRDARLVCHSLAWRPPFITLALEAQDAEARNGTASSFRSKLADERPATLPDLSKSVANARGESLLGRAAVVISLRFSLIR